MVKFRIERGISRIARVKLQAAVEESIASDIALLCDWSNNDKNYVVNELLRFALAQNTEFQTYKQSLGDRTDFELPSTHATIEQSAHFAPNNLRVETQVPPNPGKSNVKQ